jgi:hypothetical protein
MMLPAVVVVISALVFMAVICASEVRERMSSASSGSRGVGAGSAAVTSHEPLLAIVGQEMARFVRQRRFAPVLVTVMFLMYMPLVGQAIAALECRNKPIGGVTFLTSDLTVECWTGSHVAVAVGAVVIGVLMVGVGLPATVFLALRGKKAPPSMQFMSRGYRSDKKWWESVVLVRKTGLVLTASLLTNAATQSASAILLLVTSLWLHARSQPYTLGKFNVLETMSLGCMITTATVSLIYLQAVGGEDVLQTAESDRPTLDAVLDTTVTLLLLGINVVVLLLMAGTVVSGSARCRSAVKACCGKCTPCSRCACCCGGRGRDGVSGGAGRRTSAPGLVGSQRGVLSQSNPMVQSSRPRLMVSPGAGMADSKAGCTKRIAFPPDTAAAAGSSHGVLGAASLASRGGAAACHGDQDDGGRPELRGRVRTSADLRPKSSTK